MRRVLVLLNPRRKVRGVQTVSYAGLSTCLFRTASRNCDPRSDWKTPEVVLDPTLLLRADEWEEISIRPKRKRYILVYGLLARTI